MKACAGPFTRSAGGTSDGSGPPNASSTAPSTAFFAEFPEDRSPGVLDAMRLLDDIAMQGVHFAAPLFLFRKSLFTLDGVLRDVAGSEVRIDREIALQFLTRWAASFGLFYSPLTMKDFFSIEWNAATVLGGGAQTAAARRTVRSSGAPRRPSDPGQPARRFTLGTADRATAVHCMPGAANCSPTSAFDTRPSG